MLFLISSMLLSGIISSLKILVLFTVIIMIAIALLLLSILAMIITVHIIIFKIIVSYFKSSSKKCFRWFCIKFRLVCLIIITPTQAKIIILKNIYEHILYLCS